MTLQDDKLYFKKDLQKFLKSMGIPSSYPTILRYERMKLIPSPRRSIYGFKKEWRVYTGAEIKEIANILKERNRG